MTAYPPVPPPTPVVIDVLVSSQMLPDVGDRVSTKLERPLPSIRVTNVGQQEGVSDWEEAPMFQVEVWAHDDVEAERLAYALKNVWPTGTAQRHGDAIVHGRWVVQNPIPLPANDREANDTGFARYMLIVALRLTGALNG